MCLQRKKKKSWSLLQKRQIIFSLAKWLLWNGKKRSDRALKNSHGAHTHTLNSKETKEKCPKFFCSRVVILERLWKDIDFLWDGLVARFCRQSRGRKEGRKEISILRSPAGAVSWFSSKFHHVSLNQWYSSRKDPITSHRITSRILRTNYCPN